MSDLVILIEPPGFDVPGMTKSYVPASFLAAIKEETPGLFSDVVLSWAEKTRIDELIPVIAEHITPSTGYLVRVTYALDGGGLRQPAPDFITAIGIGSEPLDALAEWKRRPGIGPEASSYTKRVYLWCTRDVERLRVTCVDQVLSRELERLADIEARRRYVLGRAVSTDAATGLLRVKQGEFWREVVSKRILQLTSDVERRRMDALTRRFEASEQRLNAAYAAYQAAQKELAVRARDAELLGKISTVLGVLQIGMSSAARANDDGPLHSVATQARHDFSADLERLRALDAHLRSEWSRLKISVPAQQWIPPELP